MGLLAYNPYDPRLRYLEGGAIAPAPSPAPAPAPVARPRPQAPAAPQLPSLTAPMNGLPMGPDPFAPPPVAPPVRAMPQAPQAPAPQPNRWASAWQGFTGQAGLPEGASFADRFNASVESPGMGLGLSLLAASAPGADAGTFANSFNAFNQQRTERERARRQDARLATQDQREASIFERQQADWANADRQRGDWQTALNNERDPARRAMLQALGPEGYGQFMAQERQFEFQSREGQLDRDAQMRAAAVRAANENPLGRMFQSMDAQQLGAMNQRSAILSAQTLPALRQVRANILQAGQAATGQPIDYNSRIVLNRVFNGQGADRQALETWRARILRPALEMLPPGPATDRDVQLVMENFANPNMQLGSALSLIDERIAAAEREVMTARAANQFFGSANGLTGTTNPNGQDWPTFLAEQLESAPGLATTPQNEVPQGGFATPQASRPPPTREPPPEARRQGFTHWNGTMWVRPPASQQRRPVTQRGDRNNPYGAY